ncbi:serine/threonine-protein kinase HAL4/sat4 [Rhizopus stolonifer]|uniref:Serine/threonine-protein kinase HAL4/sat4 n=1 Tax=Rhizopus stolonifer TaxID=4846 RepID=A0A367KMX6_RHIST|nr:serine/threonine-protein kinase HAL4/sat4 [Rhizopus stolonifer]
MNCSRKPSQFFHQLVQKVTRQPAKTKLNQYGSLQKTVAGTGASATVRVLQDNNQKSLYAVKIFQKKKMMKKLLSEYCISSVFNHPNIINTFDLVLDHKHRYCIIMEYCSGGDLYSWITQDKLSSIDVKDLFRQLIYGLSYLHNLGVAHRDIKPENLLIEPKKNALLLKITDFGEADVFREIWCTQGRLSDGVCGSMPYMAPELFSMTSYDASQADVWSAAIVLLCMTLKGVPFEAARDSDPNFRLFRATHQSQAYPAFDLLDKENRQLLYDMLHPNPEKRFTINDVLKLTCL